MILEEVNNRLEKALKESPDLGSLRAVLAGNIQDLGKVQFFVHDSFKEYLELYLQNLILFKGSSVQGEQTTSKMIQDAHLVGQIEMIQKLLKVLNIK